jgi:hypothetical protein
MRISQCLIVLALGALAACSTDGPMAVAPTPGVPPSAPAFDVGNTPAVSVTGSVHFYNPDFFGNPVEVQTLTFNARTAEDGSVSGHFTYHQLFLGNMFKFRGELTCMTVIGNRAWFGALILDATNPARIGQFAWWQVTDNGEGANDPPDLGGLVGLGTEARNTAYCADHPDDIPAVGPYAITGNVQIR